MDRIGVLAIFAASFCALSAKSPAFASSATQEQGRNKACMLAAQAKEAPGEPSRQTAALMLAAHNAERAGLGLPPLEWSCDLEQQAAGWAEALLVRGKAEHASKEVRDGSGENLWMGTAGRFPVEHMVGRFIEEKRHYRHGLFPDISHTGNWADTAHYSQVVWRDTREVGCAVAQGASSDVLVCRYFPAGNIRGRAAY